jgi:2-polyprenyl-3-methyl-5-hydroxy-6-metoxy-1,4-benzoquinol methylase
VLPVEPPARDDPYAGRLTSPEYWDRYVRTQRLPRINDHRHMPWRAIARVLDRYLPPGPLRVLEVGCAASAWLPAFAARGHRCFGIDYSHVGCVLAATNLRAFGAGGAMWCADLFAPAVRPGCFDLVFSNGLVEHFENTAAVLAAIAPLARPGGTIATLVPNLSGVGGSALRRLNPDAFAKHVALRPDDLRAAHAAIGLTTEYADYAGVWFPFIAALVPPGRPRALRFALKALVHGTARPVWRIASLTGRYPEARWSSPYVLAIAKRPDA